MKNSVILVLTTKGGDDGVCELRGFFGELEGKCTNFKGTTGEQHGCNTQEHNLQLDAGSGSGSGGATGVSTGLGLSESLTVYVT